MHTYVNKKKGVERTKKQLLIHVMDSDASDKNSSKVDIIEYESIKRENISLFNVFIDHYYRNAIHKSNT